MGKNAQKVFSKNTKNLVENLTAENLHRDCRAPPQINSICSRTVTKVVIYIKLNLHIEHKPEVGATVETAKATELVSVLCYQQRLFGSIADLLKRFICANQIKSLFASLHGVERSKDDFKQARFFIEDGQTFQFFF